MDLNAEFSRRLTVSYQHALRDHALLPAEFLVYHALVAQSSREINGQPAFFSVKGADLHKAMGMSRETVRRSLLSLKTKKLVKRIAEGWLVAFDDEEPQHLS